MTIPGSSSGRTSHFECENHGSNPCPGTNAALLAREAAAYRGALDPKPEPPIVFHGPTRIPHYWTEQEMTRYVREEERGSKEAPDIAAEGS